MKFCSTRVVALAVLLAIFFYLPAQAQSWHWAQRVGGAGLEWIDATVTDSAGNIYAVGSFEGTTEFGPFTLTSEGQTDGFVARLDSSGQWQWIRQLRGPGDDYVWAAVIAGTNTVYLMGRASAPAHLDTLALSTIPHEFVGKLDATTGQVEWAVRTTAAATLAAIAPGPTGEVYVGGTFSGSGFSLGSTRLTNSSTNNSESDVFLASLSTSGQWQWAVAGGGDGSQKLAALQVDGAGNTYLLGSYSPINYPDTAYFGNHGLPFTNSFDNDFLIKLNPLHGWDWAVGIDVGDYHESGALKLDDQGNAYVAGTLFAGDLLVNDSSVLINSNVGSHQWVPFLLRFSSAGALTGVISGELRYGEYWLMRGQANGVSYLQGWTVQDSISLGGLTVTRPVGMSAWAYLAAMNFNGHGYWLMPLVVPMPSWMLCNIIAEPRLRITATGKFQGMQAFGGITLTTAAPQHYDAFVGEFGVPPLLLRFSPSAGPAGTVVTLTGTGFTGASQVLCGGVAASFTVVDDQTLIVTVPPGVSTSTQGSAIQVVTSAGPGYSVARFFGQPNGLNADATGATLALWPNPAHGTVYLSGLPAEGARVQMLDALGRVVRTSHLEPGTASLNLKDLPTGVYTVRAGAAARRLVVE